MSSEEPDWDVLRIAVDFDDVLVPLTRHFLNFCEARGVRVNREATEMWWEKVLFPDSDYSSVRSYFDDFVSSPEWLELHDEPPSKACVTALRTLKSMHGCEMIVLSSRSKLHQGITERWVGRFLPDLFSEVILCGYYDEEQAGSSKLTKSDVCKLRGISFLIDDNWTYIDEVTKRSTELTAELVHEMNVISEFPIDESSKYEFKLKKIVGILFGSNSWTVSHREMARLRGEVICTDWRDLSPELLIGHGGWAVMPGKSGLRRIKWSLVAM